MTLTLTNKRLKLHSLATVTLASFRFALYAAPYAHTHTHIVHSTHLRTEVNFIYKK